MRSATLLLCLLAGPLLAQEDRDPIESLVADLGSTEYATRQRAEDALREMGEEARPWLEAAARSDDLEVTTRARRLLARIEYRFLDGGPLADWDPALVARLWSSDTADRAKAALALAGKARKGEVPAAATGDAIEVLRRQGERATEGSNEARRLRDARALLGDAEALPAYLADRGEAIELRAVRLFGRRFHGPTSALVACAEGLEGRARLVAAGHLLGLLVRKEPVPPVVDEETRRRAQRLARSLEGEAGSEAGLIRGALLGRLATVGDADGLAALVTAVGHLPGRDRRRWLTACLTTHRTSIDERLDLLRSADDLDAEARDQLRPIAPSWLREVDGESVIGLMGDASPFVRSVAIRAAVAQGHIGFEPDDLARAAGDTDLDVRLAAAWGLVQIGHTDEGLEVVEGVLDGEDARGVCLALRLLDQLGDLAGDLGDRSRALLEDERPDVRATAALLLTLRPGRRPDPAVLALLGDEAPCRYPIARQGPRRAEGTVDEAIRSWFVRRMKEPLPEGAEAAREAARARLERPGEPEEWPPEELPEEGDPEEDR